MMQPSSPKTKLLVAVTLLVIVSAATLTRAASAAVAARWLLGAGALIAAVMWARSRGRTPQGRAPSRRLQVVERVGLSPRSALAMISVDGRELIVAYGDGFATFHPVDAVQPLHARGGLTGPREGRRALLRRRS